MGPMRRGPTAVCCDTHYLSKKGDSENLNSWHDEVNRNNG